GSPTSYASGYISAHRTVVPSQSLTCAPSSPPTYWIGLLTSGSSGSSRGHTDSVIRSPHVRLLSLATAHPAAATAGPADACLPRDGPTRPPRLSPRYRPGRAPTQPVPTPTGRGSADPVTHAGGRHPGRR